MIKRILGIILGLLLIVGVGSVGAESKYLLIPMGGPNWSGILTDIIPGTDDTYDLGSVSFNWQDLFLSGNITVDDDSWIGLGAAKGRIEFDDQTIDEVNFLDANVGINTSTPAGLLHGVLAAGRPVIFGGDVLATVTGVTGTDASPTVLTVATTNGVAEGDAVIINSGTNAIVGTYWVTAVGVDAFVTLDRNASSGGAISAASVTYVDAPSQLITNSGVLKTIYSDGTDSHIIAAKNEPGLGGRLTIGLDETARTMVIADAGDVDTDLGLSVANDPTLVIFSVDATRYVKLSTTGSGATLQAESWLTLKHTKFINTMDSDRATGNAFTHNSIAGAELTDTGSEQSWVYIEAEINQSSTGAYNALKIKVTETGTGDGSTGSGNNLILAGTSVTTDLFKVDNAGGIFASAISIGKYTWSEDFDGEVAAVQWESGSAADFWVTAGTNYAAANVTYTAGPGGTLEVKNAAADNDSVTILGASNFREAQNPIFEARIKIDDITTVHWAVGLVEGSYASNTTYDDDVILIGQDTDQAAGNVYLITNDNAAGAEFTDTGINAVNGTYLKVKFDATDPEDVRVWVNDTEIDISGANILAGTTLMPYIMVQNLAAGSIQRTLTVDYVKIWQDRG